MGKDIANSYEQRDWARSAADAEYYKTKIKEAEDRLKELHAESPTWESLIKIYERYLIRYKQSLDRLIKKYPQLT